MPDTETQPNTKTDGQTYKHTEITLDDFAQKWIELKATVTSVQECKWRQDQKSHCLAPSRRSHQTPREVTLIVHERAVEVAVGGVCLQTKGANPNRRLSAGKPEMISVVSIT